MPAKQKPCDYCGKKYWACRSDAMYCSEKCRTATKMENARFFTPVIPQSGIPGIVFNRWRKCWEARLPYCRETKQMKYIGSSKDLAEAKRLLAEVMDS